MIKLEYKEIIDGLCNKLKNHSLKHKNSVIIGDNSTGKSSLLEQLNKSTNTKLVKCPTDKTMLYDMYSKAETILIDNIETLLDFNEILSINDFVNNRFENTNIIMVTHNLEIVARLKGFNIIAIYRDCYGIYDGDDFNTSNDIINILDINNNNDIILTTLLNLQLSNKWTLKEEELLSKITKESLTSSQLKTLEEINYLRNINK